ncbi:hypothetical protein AWH48_03590 [Domibacillus aminovorans]|uniref:SbsA Ig-like domain-containing protein n=1 Tax=Domibacillus aminovorans TaxID=29332 RepID=A0A177KQZ7_9BACI|nr:hypothetical protein [Domibacillus aminovorans]OAH55769.1 hypothetical protein AWH48_03590 [Domibacillus aminovorans]
MNKKAKILSPLLLGLTLVITGCNTNTPDTQSEQKQEQPQKETQNEAQITELQPLNMMTLQITFTEPLLEEDVNTENLENIKKNFEFDNDMGIVNVPRLKTGTESTYIVPVTIQKPGTTYTVSYKGEEKQFFEASKEKINIRQTKQVTNDTFEIESFKEDGVTDYANIIEAYRADRGDLAFQVDNENKDENGEQYQVISSLRDRVVTMTSDKGEKITANYVPFTQAADGRQAPKFRLPEGQTLTPGTEYTVTSDWATIKNPTLTAEEIAPLTIKSAEAIDSKSFQITVDKDPGMELFAGRKVQLKGDDGSNIEAQYRFSSRKGPVGIFDVLNDKTLQPGVKYTVVPMNNWATADHVSLIAK